MPYLLTTQTELPVDADRLFAFFADANSLGQLTPPWLNFEMESEPPASLAPGVRLDFRMRLFRVTVRWQSEITEWNPPHRFVDEQRRGPNRWWIHTHTFTPTPDGTLMEDVVDYQPLGLGASSMFVHEVYTAKRLRAIFGYRASALRDAFDLAPEDPPTVIIVKR
jgi:ligand-binding SRPBCC domain-containing protein